MTVHTPSSPLKSSTLSPFSSLSALDLLFYFTEKMTLLLWPASLSPLYQFLPKYWTIPNSIQIHYNFMYIFNRSLQWPHVSLQLFYLSTHVQKKKKFLAIWRFFHSFILYSLFNPLWAGFSPPIMQKPLLTRITNKPHPAKSWLVLYYNLYSAFLPSFSGPSCTTGIFCWVLF